MQESSKCVRCMGKPVWLEPGWGWVVEHVNWGKDTGMQDSTFPHVCSAEKEM